ALSIECEKKMPVPSGATSPYATSTYPVAESMATDAGARWQPTTLRSRVSTGATVLHVLPPSVERAATRRAPLSARGDHQTATSIEPPRPGRSEGGHAGAGATSLRSRAARTSAVVSPAADIATSLAPMDTERSPRHSTGERVHAASRTHSRSAYDQRC